MTTQEEAGRRIKAARKAARLKLREVCAALPGLQISRLSMWERGQRMISVDEARRLAPVLRVSAAYLLTLEDEPPTPQEVALLELYRATDPRGQSVILRVAETESSYALTTDQHGTEAA